MSQIASIASPVLGTSKSSADLALRAAGVVGFAALTALASQWSIPVPGTPVPMTLQTLAVTLCAFTMGPRLGLMSMLLYFAAAAAGAPVLADGAGGWNTAIGATGGYLLGFMLAQPVMAFAARNGKAFGGAKALLAALVMGNATIFAAGVTWLAIHQNLSLADALDQGLWPFLPGS
ncbi:MAG: biotin transporter BioY, partial [Planctomycetota bacterium]|nr:biotin transporter BioY [Planctomycetota bacterium]